MVFCETLLQAGYSLYDCVSVSCLALQPSHLPIIDRRLLTIHQTGPPLIKLLVEYLISMRYSFPRNYGFLDPLRILKRTLLRMVKDDYGPDFAGPLALLWALREHKNLDVMLPQNVKKALPNLLFYPNAKEMIVKVLLQYERDMLEEIRSTNIASIPCWKDLYDVFLLATGDPDILFNDPSYFDFHYKLDAPVEIPKDPEDEASGTQYCSVTTFVFLIFTAALVPVIIMMEWRRRRRRQK